MAGRPVAAARAHLRRPGSLKGGDVPRHQSPGPCVLHNCAAISPGPRPAPRRDRRQGATTHQRSGRARVPGRGDAPADLVGTLGRARPHSGTWTGFCRRSLYRRTVLKSPARWPRCVERFQVAGRQVRDANITATMLTHAEGRLLRFNPDDFRRVRRSHRADRSGRGRLSLLFAKRALVGSTVGCTTGSCNDFLACWTHDSRYFLRQEPCDARHRCCRVAWHPAGFTS